MNRLNPPLYQVAMQNALPARIVVQLGVDSRGGHRVATVQASRRKWAGGKGWETSTDKRWPSNQWSHRDWKWIPRGSAALSSTSRSGGDLTSILPKKGKVASVRGQGTRGGRIRKNRSEAGGNNSLERSRYSELKKYIYWDPCWHPRLQSVCISYINISHLLQVLPRFSQTELMMWERSGTIINLCFKGGTRYNIIWQFFIR